MKINLGQPKQERPLLYYDIEVYPNFFMLYGESESYLHEDGTIKSDIIYFDSDLTYQEIKDSIMYIMSNYYLVGFNNFAYDDIVISHMLDKPFTGYIYNVSKQVISSQKEKGRKKYINKKLFSFDLYKDLGGFQSLKGIMCNLGLNIEETPLDFDSNVNESDKELIKVYCQNDVAATVVLGSKLMSNIRLRVFLCAQIGYWSRATLSFLTNMVYGKAPTLQYVKLPDIPISDPRLQKHFDALRNNKFHGNGDVESDTALSINMYDNDCVYGSGGLHSTNPKYTKVLVRDCYCLDVVSLYPNIINLAQIFGQNTNKYFNLLLKRMSLKKVLREFEAMQNDKAFGDVGIDLRALLKKHYKEIKEYVGDYLKSLDESKFNTVAACEVIINYVITEIDAAQTNFKLTLNKLFGTLGNQYALNYDINKLLQITLSGQMFITYLADCIVSYSDSELIQQNTDGIYFTKCSDSELKEIIQDFEDTTGLKLELEKFTHLYQKDVNNYVAVDQYGNVTAKGGQVKNYKAKNFVQNNDYAIVDLMLLKYLIYDIPFSQTLTENKHKLIMFQKTAKITQKFDYITDNEDRRYLHVNRVFATKETAQSTNTLYKVCEEPYKKAKVTNCPDTLTICNDDIKNYDFDTLKIDSSFYIKLAEKRLELWV